MSSDSISISWYLIFSVLYDVCIHALSIMRCVNEVQPVPNEGGKFMLNNSPEVVNLKSLHEPLHVPAQSL